MAGAIYMTHRVPVSQSPAGLSIVMEERLEGVPGEGD